MRDQNAFIPPGVAATKRFGAYSFHTTAASGGY
jgi:hypothetical protein